MELGSVAVAFSSGADSTFLLKVAKDVLKDRVIALTARSVLFPDREFKEAEAFCEGEGIRHVIVDAQVLSIEGFCGNPGNRCYLCKHDLFTRFLKAARESGIDNVVEGSNLDDEGDYRPGLAAVEKLGIKSPLRYASLTKNDIRQLSREMGLKTWDKPSYACLASRFVYGETISEEKLRMVDEAEQLLLDLGFRQMRVRIHGNIARIEVTPEDIAMLIAEKNRERVCSSFREIGFDYVTMDLQGYRTGSMNETLKASDRYVGDER